MYLIKCLIARYKFLDLLKMTIPKKLHLQKQILIIRASETFKHS